VNLTSTQIGSGAGELRFVLVGNHLELFFDDVLVGDTLDGVHDSGRVGVRMGGGTIDNFAASAA